MTGKPISYTFRWRAADHAEVTSLLVREQFGSGTGRLVKWIVAAIVAFAALVALAAAALGDWGASIRLAPWTLAVAVLLLGFGRLTGRLRAWQVGRMDPNVGHPFIYTLTDTGLRIGLHTFEAELKWEGMDRVRETRNMFLFYYSPRAAYFLPKRAVGAEHMDALRKQIRARLPATVPYLED